MSNTENEIKNQLINGITVSIIYVYDESLCNSKSMVTFSRGYDVSFEKEQ